MLAGMDDDPLRRFDRLVSGAAVAIPSTYVEASAVTR